MRCAELPIGGPVACGTAPPRQPLTTGVAGFPPPSCQAHRKRRNVVREAIDFLRIPWNFNKTILVLLHKAAAPYSAGARCALACSHKCIPGVFFFPSSFFLDPLK